MSLGHWRPAIGLWLMCTVALVVFISPTVTGRRFNVDGRSGGIILDTDFDITARLYQKGKVVGTKVLSQDDIKHVYGGGQLSDQITFMFDPNTMYLFQFHNDGTNAFLRRFLNTDVQNLFNDYPQSYMEFENPNTLDLGSVKNSYKCPEPRTSTYNLTWSPPSTPADLNLTIEVNTKHMQVQAYNAGQGHFGPATECKKSNNIGIIRHVQIRADEDIQP